MSLPFFRKTHMFSFFSILQNYITVANKAAYRFFYPLPFLARINKTKVSERAEHIRSNQRHCQPASNCERSNNRLINLGSANTRFYSCLYLPHVSNFTSV